MRKFLLKGLLILTSMLVVLGMLPVGQSTASANISDSMLGTHRVLSDAEVEISVSDSVYQNEENSVTNEIYQTDSLVGPYAAIGPTYPGTNVTMRIGDVLYSTKTLGGSSQIVGHVGIVNSNFKVVHVTLPVNGGTVDNMANYMWRHGAGETIKVYRPKNGRGVEAAKWAVYNYKRATEYLIQLDSPLDTLTPNYCSKFMWQAFYYGEGIDITDRGMTGDTNFFVTPSAFTRSNHFVYTTSFKAVHK